MTFWQTSSQAQKLTQIDAAIELGMTSRQAAMNMGTTRGAVIGLAFKSGRHFNPSNEGYRIAAKKAAERRNVLGGGQAHDAFSIFKSPRQTHRILDMRIDDEEEAFA